MRNAITSCCCQMDDVMGLQGLFGTLTICLSWSPPSIAIGGTRTVTDCTRISRQEVGCRIFH